VEKMDCGDDKRERGCVEDADPMRIIIRLLKLFGWVAVVIVLNGLFKHKVSNPYSYEG
jgi:hypothetical protein